MLTSEHDVDALKAMAKEADAASTAKKPAEADKAELTEEQFLAINGGGGIPVNGGSQDFPTPGLDSPTP